MSYPLYVTQQCFEWCREQHENFQLNSSLGMLWLLVFALLMLGLIELLPHISIEGMDEKNIHMALNAAHYAAEMSIAAFLAISLFL